MDFSSLTAQTAQSLLDSQREFFACGATLPYVYRLRQLNRLYYAILAHQSQLEQALQQDLGKCPFESYATEIGLVLSSISHAKKHLKQWMKPRQVSTPLHCMPAASRVEYVPFGSVLILAPYNYPVQLVMEPLIGAIAAGNCAVVSPSELTPHVSAVVQKLLNKTFPSHYICCVEGGIPNNTVLLAQRFDSIFFTGSVQVGKIVMQAAANNLIPVTLELGGKSPVIVDGTLPLRLTCERIAWGKFLNAGQTCVAPDYVLVPKALREPFVKEMIATIGRFYGQDPAKSHDFGRIVNQKHLNRLAKILESDKQWLRFGGQIDPEQRYVSPTLLCPDSWDAACMQQELFGPILPILCYDSPQDAIHFINQHEHPLALYLFSRDKAFVKTVLQHTQSGGVSINDTISHLLNPKLPFGGNGSSGMGAYHGKTSFLTFSHKRSILHRDAHVPVRLAFPPYTKQKLDLVRRILK